MAGVEVTPLFEYSDHPDDPNYVLVIAEIPQLQKVWCCRKRENASIDFHLTDSSFLLVVKMYDGSKVYKLDIKRLPKQILEDPIKTFYKVNGDAIEIHLHKKVPESWSQYLSSSGLDHSTNTA